MTSFVVECFWIGVTDDDLRRIDERAAAAVDRAGLRGRPRAVPRLGADIFEGIAEGVRNAAQDAAIPFERIVETAGSPWAD